MPVEERKNTNTKELAVPMSEVLTALGITVGAEAQVGATIERGSTLIIIVTETVR